MPEINWNEKDTLGSNLENLSKAAQVQIMGLLETYSSLSNDEQGKVRTRLAAAARAATPLDPSQHLHILYLDEHICVTNKPSGILSVPGPRRNPSLAELVYNAVQPLGINIDQMVVHRIDMDTSGIVVYALTALALRQLHADFRDRKVRKTYTALLAGHISSSSEVEVDLALERDPHRPPFMRVTQQEVYHPSLEDLAAYPGLHKFVNQAPKPSLTDLSVQSLEYIPRRDDSGSEDNVKVHVHVDSSKSSLAVTRVSLTPHTGRTHQLRVHTAALGFPVVGDDIYGFQGNGDCGIAAEVLDAAFPDRERVQRGLADLNLPLCLHAQQLCLFHPLTGAPMVFQCDAPF
jgi:tRNA pseudouridine32 synthase/23S rRNA pseudouridine746 synthase